MKGYKMKDCCLTKDITSKVSSFWRQIYVQTLQRPLANQIKKKKSNWKIEKAINRHFTEGDSSGLQMYEEMFSFSSSQRDAK